MRVGIDEAGKGPVLGPMVCAAVGVPDPEILPDGVADSKRLSPDRREELAAAIRGEDRIGVGVAAVEVERIDDPDTDMNRLTVAGQAAAARTLLGNDLASGAARDEEAVSVLADAGDTSESRFARRLAEGIDDGDRSVAVGCDVDVDARHGADDDDPVVAAASIVAKVERDARVAALAAEYGDVGSGYPSDPATRSFLETFVSEEGRLPACARRSWQTCDDVLASVEQSGLGEFS